MSAHTPRPSRATLLFRRLGQVKLAKSCKGLEPLLAECQAVSAEAMHLERTNTAMLEALKGCERVTKAWLADMKDYPLVNPEKAAATMELTRIQEAIRLAEGRP